MDAIKKNDLAGVRASLANKPDLEPACAGNEICKPLAYAAEFGDLEVIKLLMDAGADPDGKSGAGDTAFMAAEDAFSFAGKSRPEIRAVQE
jgi:ankyrin repeat protein